MNMIDWSKPVEVIVNNEDTKDRQVIAVHAVHGAHHVVYSWGTNVYVFAVDNWGKPLNSGTSLLSVRNTPPPKPKVWVLQWVWNNKEISYTVVNKPPTNFTVGRQYDYAKLVDIKEVEFDNCN